METAESTTEAVAEETAINEPVAPEQEAVATEQSTETTEPTETAELPEYADFVVPEGVTLDQELTAEFKSVAKEVGLNQDQAQKMTDMAVKLSQKFAENQHKAMTEQRNVWEESARSDKEFGGDQFDANLAVAKKALDAFATPELVKLLNESGLGSNPDIIRTFYRVGKKLSEDAMMPGTRAPETVKRTLSQTLYPDMN